MLSTEDDFRFCLMFSADDEVINPELFVSENHSRTSPASVTRKPHTKKDFSRW